MTKKRMAYNAARNILKLIVCFICWALIELYYRAKWFKQDMDARIMGYRSHAHLTQTLLNMRHQVYDAQKNHRTDVLDFA